MPLQGQGSEQKPASQKKNAVRWFSDNISSVANNIPTDVGIKDNKLGLKNGTTWLTNSNAINLEGFAYNENTNTLKAEGGSAIILRKW